MKKQAFTLAEVLITLVIIGVIAALTIPTLMNNMRDEANIVALKKFYSETNQLLQTVAVEDCGTTGSLGCFDTKADMEQTIAKHFKVSKICGNDASKNCWATFNENFDGTGNNFDPDDNNASAYSLVTLDGMSIQISIDNAKCLDSGNVNPNSPMHKYCGGISVDINGSKPPNRAGKDVFYFLITSNKYPLLYPFGGKDFNHWENPPSCQSSHPRGWTCTGRITENGWKADYSDAAED